MDYQTILQPCHQCFSLLPVVALGVVPAQPVVEEVVEKRGAGLLAEPVSLQDPVRLGPAARPAGAPPVKLKSIYQVPPLR